MAPVLKFCLLFVLVGVLWPVGGYSQEHEEQPESGNAGDEAPADETVWREEEDAVVLDPPDGEPYRVPGSCGDWSGGNRAREDLFWVDRSHAAISRGLCWPTRWFDGFFGNPDDEARASAGTYLSITAGQRWQDGGDDDDQRLDYSSRVSLPGLQRRLSLVFSSDDTDSEDPLAVGDEDDGVVQAGVRWVIRTSDRMDLDADATLTSDVRPLFRVRYRETWSITGSWAFRLSENLSWRDPEGMASQSDFDFSRPFGSRNVLRFGTRLDWSEEDFPEDGWDWRQVASVGTRLNQRSALLYQLRADGVTRPSRRVDQYIASVRYRRNIWRPWFFYEIEPFVFWPRDRDFQTIQGIWFRIETRWGKY